MQSSLAPGKSIPEWDSCATIGIYVGPSPRHTHSVALVLNPTTGLVSPQPLMISSKWHISIVKRLPFAWQKLVEFLGKSLLWEKADSGGNQENQMDHGKNIYQGRQILREQEIGQYPQNDTKFAPVDIFEELHQYIWAKSSRKWWRAWIIVLHQNIMGFSCCDQPNLSFWR